jgi:hypothetical protein
MPVWLGPWSSVALASEPVVSSQLIVTEPLPRQYLYVCTSNASKLLVHTYKY